MELINWWKWWERAGNERPRHCGHQAPLTEHHFQPHWALVAQEARAVRSSSLDVVLAVQPPSPEPEHPLWGKAWSRTIPWDPWRTGASLPC